MESKLQKELKLKYPPKQYSLFAPLDKAVHFICDANQLSALIILSNFDRYTKDNVIVPMADGRQSIGIYIG